VPPFIQQSILERKLQYLSIPIHSPLDLLVGQGLGSYTVLLEEKSPGLYFWQFQPIHNTLVLWVFEVGILPLFAIALYGVISLRNFAKRYEASYKIHENQKLILVIGGVTVLLLLVDHYTWDIEQGQFLIVLFVTILIFFFRNPIFKSVK
jgi:hypothetical protein